MQRSEQRILTTHTGSLPGPFAWRSYLFSKSNSSFRMRVNCTGKSRPHSILLSGNNSAPASTSATMARSPHRLLDICDAADDGVWGTSARRSIIDTQKFPEYADFLRRQVGAPGEGPRVWNAPQAVGAVSYDHTLSEAKRENTAFTSCLQRQQGRFVETFMSAASPGILSTTMLRASHNPAYASDEEYVLSSRPTKCARNTNMWSRRAIFSTRCPRPGDGTYYHVW